MVRRSVFLAAGAALLAGCGGDGHARSAVSPLPTAAVSDPPTAHPSAPVLVFFQRQGAAGATLDTFTVRRDGSARLEKRYGGAGGRFKNLELRPGELARLKAALARLPRSGSTLTRGSPPPGGAQYLVRYRGRTQTARQGGVVPAARPAVRLLDGFIDGIGVRAPTRNDP